MECWLLSVGNLTCDSCWLRRLFVEEMVLGFQVCLLILLSHRRVSTCLRQHWHRTAEEPDDQWSPGTDHICWGAGVLNYSHDLWQHFPIAGSLTRPKMSFESMPEKLSDVTVECRCETSQLIRPLLWQARNAKFSPLVTKYVRAITKSWPWFSWSNTEVAQLSTELS